MEFIPVGWGIGATVTGIASALSGVLPASNEIDVEKVRLSISIAAIVAAAIFFWQEFKARRKEAAVRFEREKADAVAMAKRDEFILSELKAVRVAVESNRAFRDSICAAHDKRAEAMEKRVDGIEGRVLKLEERKH